MPYVNSKCTDQTAHLHSLISTFDVRCLDSIIPTLSKSKTSKLYLASVAVQAGLSLTWSQTPKNGSYKTYWTLFLTECSIYNTFQYVFLWCGRLQIFD